MQFNSRFSFVYKLLREIKGLSYLYKNIVDNLFNKKSKVYKSDYSEKKINRLKDETFSEFFMRVERIRYEDILDKRISKNVKNIEQARSGSEWWILKMEEYCQLTNNSYVLDFGCGGLRLGYGLINYLDDNHYTGLDITSEFYTEAIDKMPDISSLLKKSPNLGLTSDSKDLYPLNDIAISTMVVSHIQKKDLNIFFQNINNRIKKSGYLIFDFVHFIFNMRLNNTSFAYQYKIIERALMNAGFKPLQLFGWAIVAVKEN